MEKRTLLNALTVGDIRELLVDKPSTIGPDASLVELLERMIEDTRTRHIYVVDDANHLLGVVRMSTVVELLFPLSALDAQMADPYMFHQINLGGQTVGEVMNRRPRAVHAESGLQELANTLLEEKITELPVVDQSNVLLGQVNVYEIIKSYLQIRRD